jgi:transposase
MEKVYVMFPMLQVLVQFLKDLYYIFDTRNVEELDSFISKYINSEIYSLAQYAKGLQNDYIAVKNSLLYPDVSNGPIEGINSRIKMKHRRSSGREGLELLNAYMVIPKKLIDPYIRI